MLPLTPHPHIDYHNWCRTSESNRRSPRGARDLQSLPAPYRNNAAICFHYYTVSLFPIRFDERLNLILQLRNAGLGGSEL